MEPLTNIAAKVLAAIEAEPHRFDMGHWLGSPADENGVKLDLDDDLDAWNRCDTTLCVAGWAIFLAGEKAQAMATCRHPAVVATGLFEAVGETVPDFYTNPREALRQLRYLAANPTGSLRDVPDEDES